MIHFLRCYHDHDHDHDHHHDNHDDHDDHNKHADHDYGDSDSDDDGNAMILHTKHSKYMHNIYQFMHRIHFSRAGFTFHAQDSLFARSQWSWIKMLLLMS